VDTTAKRTDPPFRAEHVGSLLRPKILTQAFRSFSGGEIGADAFREIQDNAIREVVRMQEDIGLRAITDGEFRRVSYWAHFVEKMEGLSVNTSAFKFTSDAGGEQEFLAPKITGKLRWPGSASAHEVAFVVSVAQATPKVTLPSPPTMHFWDPERGLGDGAYANRDEAFADLASIYRQEIKALYDAGARYVQLDEVPLAMLCDPAIQDKVRGFGEEPKDLIDAYIRLFNDCLAGKPEDLTTAMHFCRGNFKGQWLSEGGYAVVAERVFSEIDVDALFLEYDTPRAGDFEPLSQVSPNKTAVLGLVTSKAPELEDPDELKRRIDEAAKFLPLDQLALSPQCGFASTVAGNPVTLDDERRKLGLIVDVARDVWGTA
jgi:5-methyltetrahydropteroyltriglutamate--homocysteine methyltransferase